MFCTRCGTQIEAGSVFCSNCGERVVTRSPSLAVSPQKRPLGLVLVVIFTAFSGVLELLLGTGGLLASGLPVPVWISFLAILFILLGVLDLAACYGLWSFQKWGLTLAIVLYIASIPLSILLMITPIPGVEVTGWDVLLQVVGIAVAIGILIYLFKPEVRALFR